MRIGKNGASSHPDLNVLRELREHPEEKIWLENSSLGLFSSPPVSISSFYHSMSWDTAVEEGVNRLCASPKKKIGAMFQASTFFPFNAVLRQAWDGPHELFGRHVHNVLGSNTDFGEERIEYMWIQA